MKEGGYLPPPSTPPSPTGLLELSHLVLDQTRVTDAGLAGFLLGSPPALSHLSLNRTGITERTLLLLPQCAPQLRELGLKQTGVSGEPASRCNGPEWGDSEWGELLSL